MATADRERARILKAQYDEHKLSDPQRASSAAAELAALASSTADSEVRALAEWTAAMAALQLHGQAQEALPLIERSAEAFERLGLQHDAASTQLTRMHALGLLGRYQDAVAAGEWAAEIFAQLGDPIAAGKVEQNLGNLSLRRDDYAAAERFYRSARDRFRPIRDDALLARAENNLGYALMLSHEFRAAGEALARALVAAESAGASLTRAEIEDNLGCLALVQGHYDQALDYLEQARRRLVALDLPHEAALAERELADTYLELQLIPEAAEIYARVVPMFERLGMRAEHAWALVHQARALQALDRADDAATCLAQAHALYRAEGNPVGSAMATLAEAELLYSRHDLPGAVERAERAEAVFASAGAQSRLLQARILRADALRLLRHPDAGDVLRQLLRDADEHGLPRISLRCYTSLGLLARAQGKDGAADQAFRAAIGIIEQLRSPLPGDQFRTAFLGHNLVPFTELARLRLEHGKPADALQYVEQSRSRALLDMIGAAAPAPTPRDDFERELMERLEQLREELNWIESQLNRHVGSATAQLDAQAREREAAILTATRQLQQRTGASGVESSQEFDLAALQEQIGQHTALVEYFALDGELLAFVATDRGVQVVRGLGDDAKVTSAVQQLRFQLNTLRFGSQSVRQHVDQLTQRALHHMRSLYDLLLRPVEPYVGERRLAIVPHRVLHYVPFQALHDGERYLIERREVVYAPSAAVLVHCLAQPRARIDNAVLVGLADCRAPRVSEEVTSLAPLFAHAEVLLDEEARLGEVRARAPMAHLLHLACHGQFRPDSPLFSSLQLADGRLSVRDASLLDLASCQLVTLSACETGVSVIAPGDELIGLTRGFMSAGTPSLVVSLWVVDDASTAKLMRGVYQHLQNGQDPAAALRASQCELLAESPHPYFWAPFCVVGRW